MTDLGSVGSTAVFAAVYVALHASHRVADHWVQTSHQACNKDRAGWVGRWNCLKHVASYTATNLVALWALVVFLDVDLSGVRVMAGLAVSASTHYFADRRTPLRWVARVTGAEGYFQLGAKRRDDGRFEYGPGTGQFELDQAWHVGWLFVSALVIAA